ncbi:hypothetical protein ACHAPT_007017 [Fusarium lateritium]
MSGKEQDKKAEWTQDAKARVMAANAKSGGNSEFSKSAQSQADKTEHAKAQAQAQVQKK